MAINQVEIKDFLVFKGEFSADFCSGINVLIGGNGTGKTTLIKAMYMVCDLAKNRNKFNPIENDKKNNEVNNLENEFHEEMHVNAIDQHFQYIASTKGMINGYADENGSIIDKNEPINLTFRYGSDISTKITIYGVNDCKSFIFIPTNDMLSHSKGFLALDKERELPFDKTYIDILSKAELPVTRVITPNTERVINKIKKIIGGEVLYENDMFYVVNTNKIKTPFSLEASGFRKFGLLWKLLRNGLLEEGSILFWDEPENSLNPELIPVLVDILLTLSRYGVQIFLATHNYYLARYFDVKKSNDVSVMFHNLSKKHNGQIICKTTPKYIKIPDNLFEKASADLFDAVVEYAMGDE